MEFFKCSIGGEMYGTGITEIEKGGAERAGIKIDDDEVQLYFILVGAITVCHYVRKINNVYCHLTFIG